MKIKFFLVSYFSKHVTLKVNTKFINYHSSDIMKQTQYGLTSAISSKMQVFLLITKKIYNIFKVFGILILHEYSGIYFNTFRNNFTEMYQQVSILYQK